MADTSDEIQTEDTLSDRDAHDIDLEGGFTGRIKREMPFRRSPCTHTTFSYPIEQAWCTCRVNEGSLSKTMKQKIDAFSRKSDDIEQFTIFRIPEKVRRGKVNIIEPSVVSIGPYHHGREHLHALEEKKWRFLEDFLSRGDDISLETCIDEIKDLEGKARGCYSEIINMDSDSFVEMMILDGCFILELFIKWIHDTDNFGTWDAGWSGCYISEDLILMENQIPFFIIQKLWDIVTGGKEFGSREMKALTFLMTDNRMSRKKWNPPLPKEIHHLLHLCHHSIVPTIPDKSNHELLALVYMTSLDPNLHGLPGILKGSYYKMLHCCTLSLSWLLMGLYKLFIGFYKSLCCYFNISRLFKRSGESNVDKSTMVIPCATELREAGIKFKKKNPPCDPIEITFRSGTLEIPYIQIDDSIKPLLMNLIAFEQCICLNKPKPITNYTYFMDCIVNTPNDVAILQRKGIIENMLSGEQEVADFFNQLGEGRMIYLDPHLSNLFEEVNKYCELRRHKYRAKLSRNYFSNPWSIISLIAAFVLLVLTLLQTFFAMYSYFHPP